MYWKRKLYNNENYKTWDITFVDLQRGKTPQSGLEWVWFIVLQVKKKPETRYKFDFQIPVYVTSYIINIDVIV